MSVPIAVVGWIPKMRISSGVIREPPPMPVMPTSMPMPSPKTMIAGSILSAWIVIDFPDHFGQEHECARIPQMPAKAKEFATPATLSASENGAGIGLSIQGVIHSYAELRTIEGLDL